MVTLASDAKRKKIYVYIYILNYMHIILYTYIYILYIYILYIYIYIYIDLLLRRLLISELRDADDRARHPKSVVLAPNTAKKSFHSAN